MHYVMLLLGIIVSYLIGSIPTAYIFGKILKGIDIRDYGSGNMGATNVFRVIGKVPGVIVLGIDMLKGFLCASCVASLFLYIAHFARPELYRIFMGIAAIGGHNWTIFLKFKGGKGVATSAGVVMGIIPKIFWLGFLVWLIIFFVTGYVSLGSIIASVVVPIFTLAFGQPTEIIIFMSILCLVIVFKHRANIKRLSKGEEKKIALFKKH